MTSLTPTIHVRKAKGLPGPGPDGLRKHVFFSILTGGALVSQELMEDQPDAYGRYLESEAIKQFGLILYGPARGALHQVHRAINSSPVIPDAKVTAALETLRAYLSPTFSVNVSLKAEADMPAALKALGLTP